ncbi:MAG: ATP-binding protein [Bacteroidetes bacterium]|nr:ATP-binding protein [Bacteroidota bacterium]MCB0844801.1 ATP-binding protein [Bacteroidota bacterium]
MKKRLPVGIQSFSEIREHGYLYIDKTKDIFRLIDSGKYFFLSRPRRFGKSLTLSTIKEIFQGRKDLFQGLWIEDQWNWNEQYPVVHISFSSIGYKELGLEKAIELSLLGIAKQFNIVIEKQGISQIFKELIIKLSRINHVILLIDEYDKPIIDYLDDIDQAKANQRVLKAFYSIIKDSDAFLRFLLITGVSKFSKVSIFSELNNLNDITIDRRFSKLVGVTQGELEANFDGFISQSSESLKLSREELLLRIKEWYNGYSWDGETFVYNPFSLLNFFLKSDFQNFWFTTGTPTFLVKLLKGRQEIDLENVEVDQSAFESYDIDNLDTLPLLFQTGYCTIKSVEEFGIYILDYPNKEVKESLLRHLIGAYRNDSPAKTTPIVIKLRKAFIDNDFERIIFIINSLFKSIPSHIFIKEKEAYYHSIVFLIFQYLGQFIDAEVHTSDGRIDAVVQTDTHIYIVEFKLDENADAALQQIRDKKYASRYLGSEKSIIVLGINFSSETKSVDDWKVENY